MLAFFTAGICCLGVFTACGNNESSKTDETSASDTADASAASGNKENVQEYSGEELADVLRTFFISGDSMKMLEASLPDDIIKSMENIGGIDVISETLASAVAQSMSGVPEMDAGAIEYISDTDCTDEFRSKLEKLYSAYYDIYRIMDDNGIRYEEYLAGDVEDKSVSDALDRYGKLCTGEDTDTAQTITFEDVRVVTFSMNGDNTEFVMYKVNGEGWKLDTIGLAVFEY